MLDASTLTSTQVALGTPGYVAPEYQTFGSIDARSDLFSLGVVLYETTSGSLPFDPALQANCVSGVLPAPERLSRRVPDLPTFFDEIVMTLLAVDPDDRPRDGFEAYDLLRRLLEGEGALQPPESQARDSARGMRAPTPVPSSPSRHGIANEATSPPTSSPIRRAGPHLTTVTAERIGPLCRAALDRLLTRAGAAANGPAAHAAIEECRRLVASVSSIADMVATDTHARELAQARGRSARGDLGRRLDEAAREHSRTLGWAGTIAERTYAVHTARTSGEHPVPAVEAMVWEQAALEQEEDRARDRATELDLTRHALQAELDRTNERLEHEMLVITAQLEGRIGALRSIALEAAMALEDAARDLAVPPEALWTDG